MLNNLNHIFEPTNFFELLQLIWILHSSNETTLIPIIVGTLLISSLLVGLIWYSWRDEDKETKSQKIRRLVNKKDFLDRRIMYYEYTGNHEMVNTLKEQREEVVKDIMLAFLEQ